MRVASVSVVVGLLGLAISPATALAHRSHTKVRDHRHGSGSGSSGSGSGSGSHGHHSKGGGWGALLVDVLATVAESTNDANASEPDTDDPDAGPTWMVEIGGLARRFEGPVLRRMGTVDGNPYMLDSGGSSSADTTAAAFDMRATVMVADHLYAGAELEVGGLVRSPIRLVGSPDLRVASRVLIGSASVVGARLQHGAAELDGEIAGGFHVVSTTVQPAEMSADGEDTPSDSANAVRPLVEARLRGALWISPRTFIAAQVGTSAIDRSDVHVAFSVGFASRAFGER